MLVHRVEYPHCFCFRDVTPKAVKMTVMLQLYLPKAGVVSWWQEEAWKCEKNVLIMQSSLSSKSTRPAPQFSSPH